MDKIPRQKISKETEDLNNTIHQLDLTGVYRTLHPNQQNTHILLRVSRTDHMVGHKTSLRYKKTEVIESKFSDHS